MPGRPAISESASQTAGVTTSEQRPRRPRQNADEPSPPSKTYSVAASQPVEPEDAYLTGVSRSLQRRLLGLNVDSTRKPRREAEALELVPTGSPAGPASVPAASEKKSRIA